MPEHPICIPIHVFSLGQLGRGLRRKPVLNDRSLPVPHTAVCLQSTTPTAEPPLARSLPPEDKREAKDNKRPHVVGSGHEHPEAVSGSFAWSSAKLWCRAELQVSDQAAPPFVAEDARGWSPAMTSRLSPAMWGT